eukprot:GHVT01058957.1.p2 GENE.GHVT01058957.1~~GHVT01058957.1.p2  ORF type:complete len:203 (+),score=24.28 GHVT01058957.1:1352-1960(+)
MWGAPAASQALKFPPGTVLYIIDAELTFSGDHLFFTMGPGTAISKRFHNDADSSDLKKLLATVVAKGGGYRCSRLEEVSLASARRGDSVVLAHTIKSAKTAESVADESPYTFAVKGYVRTVLCPSLDKVMYKACSSCRKKLQGDQDTFFCKNCDTPVDKLGAAGQGGRRPRHRSGAVTRGPSPPHFPLKRAGAGAGAFTRDP